MGPQDDDDGWIEEMVLTWKLVSEHYNPQKHGPIYKVKNSTTGREFEFKIVMLPGDRYLVLCNGHKVAGGEI